MRTIYLRLWGVLIFLLAAFTVSAQSVVKGKITDNQQEALVGVSVMVKGTSAGSVSDDRGNSPCQCLRGLQPLYWSFH